MNRRLFAAGIAALGTSTVSAQGTPVAGDALPRDVLGRYLNEVVQQGDMDAIRELFDDQAFDLDEVYWQHVEDQISIRRNGGSVQLAIQFLFGDALGAMAYVTVTTHDGGKSDSHDAFYVIHSSSGQIRWLRTMAD